jgi:hypothetical protein
VETVAKKLADAPESRIETVATPLTGHNRRRRYQAEGKPVAPPQVRKATMPATTCKRCGGAVPRRGRVYCDACLPHYQREQYAEAFHGSGLEAIEQRRRQGEDPTHGKDVAERRAKANVQRKSEVREWDARFGKLTDLSAFQREILPLIQNIPLSRLQRATGLSLRYVSQIRRGEKTPHPRHWQNFRSTQAPTEATPSDPTGLE